MLIREETKDDFLEIYNLIKTAFQTAKVSDGTEQDFANSLRNSKNYIPELALVAEENNNIIGHIMLTKFLITLNNQNSEELLLAPISVKLEYRSKGVGSELIKESFKRAIQLGYKSIFLVGDPLYYNRFGFRQTTQFNIINNNNIPNKNVMVCELKENYFLNKIGAISIIV